MSRVTVSLDALDDALFRRMNDADFAVADVLEGIDAAHAVGLAPLKVNMVVKRGTNDGEILPMARHFKGCGTVLRFIEYMDVGTSNGWNMTEVLPSAEVVARIAEHFPLAPLEAHSAAETAQRWGYADGSGEIGVISSVTRAFCGTCTRARLSTEGKLYLCLFAIYGHDLRALAAQRRERRRHRDRRRATSGKAHRPLFATARQQRAARRRPRRAARRDVVHRRLKWLAHANSRVGRENITGVVLAGGRGIAHGRRRQGHAAVRTASRSRSTCCGASRPRPARC